MKKLVSLLCILLAMVFVLSACSTGTVNTSPSASAAASASAPAASASAEPSVAPSPELPKYKIGLVYYTTSNAWFERVQNALKPLAEAYNCELVLGKPAGTSDECLASVENLCTAGVNAIIAQATGGVTPRIVEICEKNNVYFAGTDADITKDPGYDTVASNKYMVASVIPNDYQESYDITKEMIDKGITKFAILGLPPGVSIGFDNRINGSLGALKDAGLTPVADARSFNLVEAGQNLLTQNKDIEAICTSIDATQYLEQPMLAAGLAGKILIMAYEDSGDCAASFNLGTLSYVIEASANRAQLAFAFIYNALSGNEIRQDGKAPVLVVKGLVMRSAEDYKAFLEKSAFTVDEIKNLIVMATPDATLDSYTKLVANFNIDTVKAK